MTITLVATCLAVLVGQRPGRDRSPGDGAQPHAVASLPEFFGRDDAGRGILPHDAGSRAGRVGRDDSLGRGRPARAVLPRAVLLVSPSRAARARADRCDDHAGHDHHEPHERFDSRRNSDSVSRTARTRRRPMRSRGRSAAFGLAVHSLVGGVALASAVAADFRSVGRSGPRAWACCWPRSCTSRPMP